MTDRIVTTPSSTDQFVLSDRPAPTLSQRYRPLPDGLNTSHYTVVPAHQVRAGDVVAAFFTNGPGIRHAKHVAEAFPAHPRAFGRCTAECQACKDVPFGATDRYVCLDPADERADCVIHFRNTPVAIIPADVAACFPPLDSAPLLPDLFILDHSDYGPYEALPVSRGWGPWNALSITRDTAEQIATDLTISDANRHLTCHWLHDSLLISSDPRLRTEPGRPGHLIRPDADGRYLIGGLWQWEKWAAPSCPACSSDTEEIDIEDDTVWRCTGPDCTRRTYGTGDLDDDQDLPPYTEIDEDGATIIYHGTGEVDIEATAELAAQNTPEDDDQDVSTA
ncbi:hypothetical protein [Streptomyces sp. NPDC048272]|uniref:hypothetical protein n=1 Tax=Streptomyces sp. NPDC048272 TaxID=3154616 RepID=UPI00343C1C14